jgi:hypothetical protein
VKSDTPLKHHQYGGNSSRESLDQIHPKEEHLPSNANKKQSKQAVSGHNASSKISAEDDTTICNLLNDGPVTPGFGADAISHMSFAHYNGFKTEQVRSGSISSEDTTLSLRERQDSQSSLRTTLSTVEKGCTDDEANTSCKSNDPPRKKNQKDGYVAEMARRIMRKGSDSTLPITIERQQRSISEGRNVKRDKIGKNLNGSNNHWKTASEDRSQINHSDQSDDSSSGAVAQLAARFGKLQSTNRPLSVKASQSESNLVSSLASPTRAAAMADVKADADAFKHRRKSKEFSAMQRSVMANAAASITSLSNMKEPEPLKSPKKSKLSFFGHKKAGSSDIASNNLHDRNNRESRRLSDSATDLAILPNLPPGSNVNDVPLYNIDEPRASSISIADEISKLLPDAGWTALATGGGGWAALPYTSPTTPVSQQLSQRQLGQVDSIEDRLKSEETDDLLLQLLVSQAVVDAKDFEVLGLEEVDEIKNTHRLLQARVQSQGARLALETKIREAARNLSRLHAGNRELARQANDQLQASNRKVDQVATELWKLTQRAADMQRSWLQHTAGTLARGIKSLEEQLDIARSQMHNTANAVADTQIADRVTHATIGLRLEADSYKKELEARQREVRSLRGELEATTLKLDTMAVVGNAGEEAARNAEGRLTTIETELESARKRLYIMESELKDAREQLERYQAESPGDLRAAVQATLREAMLSKEKSRTRAEAEKRRREEAEQRIDGLTRELEELRIAAIAKPAKNDGDALQERDKRITTLQRQIKEAAEDIDSLRAESQETNEILRDLFSGMPELTPISSEPDKPPPSPRLSAQTRYSLDAFVLRIQNLIAHYRRLTDKVLTLQERSEELTAQIEQKKEMSTELEERVEQLEQQLKEAKERADQEKKRADLAVEKAHDEADSRIKTLETELTLLQEREVDVQTAVTRLTKDLEKTEETTSLSEEAINKKMVEAEARAEERIIQIKYESREQIEATNAKLADVTERMEQAEIRAKDALLKLDEEQIRANQAEARLKKITDEAAGKEDTYKQCYIKLRERLSVIAYKEMDLDANANTLRTHLRQLQHAAIDLHHILMNMLGDNDEMKDIEVLPPTHGRQDSVGILEYRSELEMAKREVERLQRMAAEWQDERMMLEMNVEAYRARVADLEKKL